MRQPIRLTGCRDVLANMMLLHTCAAALCRRLYIRPGMGIGHFKHAFGGRIRTRGCKPEHHGLASSGNIRHILKNLETVGLVEKMPNGGRKLTSSGQRDMDLIAGRVPVNLFIF